MIPKIKEDTSYNSEIPVNIRAYIVSVIGTIYHWIVYGCPIHCHPTTYIWIDIMQLAKHRLKLCFLCTFIVLFIR